MHYPPARTCMLHAATALWQLNSLCHMRHNCDALKPCLHRVWYGKPLFHVLEY